MAINDDAIIQDFNGARTPQELAALLQNPTTDQARALAALLGEEKLHRLRGLAFALASTRAIAPPKAGRNVVVLPGIMGSELSIGSGNLAYKLWLDLFRVARQGLNALKIGGGAGSASPPTAVTATGLILKYYGEILLTLGLSWNVRAFPYDWRSDLDTAAATLLQFIRNEFNGEPVSLIAHSMGGLVSRALWRLKPEANNNKPLLNRLIMLGTPNRGSFEVPLILTGIEDTVKKLIWLTHPILSIFDQEKARQDILSVLSTFPAVYQMLPRDGEGSDLIAAAETYRVANPGVSAAFLQRGQQFLDSLVGVVDPDRMTYVAGYGFDTIAAYDKSRPIADLSSYWVTTAGDGRVPHTLGLLPHVPTYYVPTQHGELPNDASVLTALDDLLATGATQRLVSELPADRAVQTMRRPTTDAVGEQQFMAAAFDWQERAASLRGKPPGKIDPQAERLKEAILEGWLADRKLPSAESTTAPNAVPPSTRPSIFISSAAPAAAGTIATEKFSITVRLVADNIANCHQQGSYAPPIDAISVGIYENQRRPWGAVRDLDRSMQGTLGGELLSDLIARGTARGELAIPTLVPDPREPSIPAGRHIVLIGQGTAGQFGATETRQLTRELAWYVGRLGKKHLATIPIVSGAKNLPLGVAMRESLRGLARAISDARRDGTSALRLQVVTFVELYEDRIRELHDAIKTYGKEIFNEVGVELIFECWSEEQLRLADKAGIERLCKMTAEKITRRAKQGNAEDDEQQQPTRLSVEQIQDSFWFSAQTASASIPQRQVEIDPLIVDDQNDGVVSATTNAEQIKAGLVLGRLLIPDGFRELFSSGVPVVVGVDTNTARIHWELMVHSSSELDAADDAEDPQFLSLNRRFTRQLRTRFAPLPEPLPVIGRRMRALIIADPAADAPLQGAQREGLEVADIFRKFNERASDGSRIDVTELIGPGPALRSRVLGELLVGQFDLVHYAGHCFFDEANPQACGWLFRLRNENGRREVLAARELRRVSRLPWFIFSNACESGVMPYQPEERHSNCAPAFAETFFERGVGNLICTGWPVGDRAARVFARAFYGHMLGLRFDQDSETIEVSGIADPSSMAIAMQEARKEVRETGGGIRTWGAYQHYGNPFAKFFLSRPYIDPKSRIPDLNPRSPRGPSGGKDAVPTTGKSPVGGPASSGQDSTGEVIDSATVAEDAAHVTAFTEKLAPSNIPADSAFANVQKTIERNQFSLVHLPGVLDVRPGYQFVNNWISRQPAIVVLIAPSQAPPSVPPVLDGFPVEVRRASPAEQIEFIAELSATARTVDMRRFLSPGEVPEVEELRALTEYVPPSNLQLDPVEEEMIFTCHVSPDCGFPVLSEFLDGVENNLVVAMYDFTAPHIRDDIRAATRPIGRTLKLILDPSLSLQDGGSDDNPKADDVDEDQIIEFLSHALGKRFQFVWAAVTHKGKVQDGIFPKAYHIKVAVRDRKAIWLSSGNWQSSNQPPLDVVPAVPPSDFDISGVMGKYNREWHAVVDNATLAATFAKIIEWDFTQAKPHQVEEGRGGEVETLPDLLMPIEEAERRVPQGKPIKPLMVSRRLKIQPVLTPDNYPDVVAALIEGATKSIRFQNQYINIGKTIPPGFDRLLTALKAKCEDPNVQVRIILRKIGDVSKMLEALLAYGFDATDGNMFRLQLATHTKGIVVDDTIALVGSHNWSGPGTTRNRDASLLIEDAEIASYYAKVFDDDWAFRARAEVPDDRDMPRVASPTRDLTTPPRMRRIPWSDYFEDADDV